MSNWSHIFGTITVEPLGRSQSEKRYILDTVLDHLPKVTGSEEDMNTYVIQKAGFNSSCSHDEFGQYSNLGTGSSYNRRPPFETQDKYFIVVDADLRDRKFIETIKEFTNWICRLSKRLYVQDMIVKVTADDTSKTYLFCNDNDVFTNMFEKPSWVVDTDGEPNWCEFMMWDYAKDSSYPMTLAYKYYNDPENDKEVERRIKYSRIF